MTIVLSFPMIFLNLTAVTSAALSEMQNSIKVTTMADFMLCVSAVKSYRFILPPHSGQKRADAAFSAPHDLHLIFVLSAPPHSEQNLPPLDCAPHCGHTIVSAVAAFVISTWPAKFVSRAFWKICSL